MTESTAPVAARAAHPVREWLAGVARVPAAILLWPPLLLGVEWLVHAIGGPPELLVGSMNAVVPLALVAGLALAARAIVRAQQPWIVKAVAIAGTVALQAVAALLALVVLLKDVR